MDKKISMDNEKGLDKTKKTSKLNHKLSIIGYKIFELLKNNRDSKCNIQIINELIKYENKTKQTFDIKKILENINSAKEKKVGNVSYNNLDNIRSNIYSLLSKENENNKYDQDQIIYFIENCLSNEEITNNLITLRISFEEFEEKIENVKNEIFNKIKTYLTTNGFNKIINDLENNNNTFKKIIYKNLSGIKNVEEFNVENCVIESIYQYCKTNEILSKKFNAKNEESVKIFIKSNMGSSLDTIVAKLIVEVE